MVFGAVEAVVEGSPEAETQERGRSIERRRRWDAIPRDLKASIARVHQNLGHPDLAVLLRSMRITKASSSALRAARLFQCPDCPNRGRPKIPKPSKLPTVDEFNVILGMDCFAEKCAE